MRSDPVQDLRVVSRFKNNVLFEKMNGMTAAELSRKTGVRQDKIGLMLNLRQHPLQAFTGKKGAAGAVRLIPGKWREPVLILSRYFRCLPEDLFPPSLYDLPLPHSVHKTYASVELVPLLEAAKLKYLPQMEEGIDSESAREAISQVLGTLTPMQRHVIEMRYGLEDGSKHTFKEIGQPFALSKARICQLEAKALHKLRGPLRADVLRPWRDSIDSSRSHISQ